MLVRDAPPATGDALMIADKVSSSTSGNRLARRVVGRNLLAVAALLMATPAITTSALAQTPTMLVLSAVPARSNNGGSSAPLPPLVKSDITEIKIGGKPADITGFDPLLKGPHTLQLMILFDSMQMLGAQGQFDDLKRFIGDLPPN